MNTMKGLMLASALSLGLWTATADTARATDNYYAAVSVRNPTNNTLRYQFRWGQNSGWVSYTVYPNSVRTHYYPYSYANQNSSPTPQINFHYNPGAGYPDYKVYDLQAYAAPYSSPEYARPYTFRYVSPSYLELYSGN